MYAWALLWFPGGESDLSVCWAQVWGVNYENLCSEILIGFSIIVMKLVLKQWPRVWESRSPPHSLSLRTAWSEIVNHRLQPMHGALGLGGASDHQRRARLSVVMVRVPSVTLSLGKWTDHVFISACRKNGRFLTFIDTSLNPFFELPFLPLHWKDWFRYQ